MRMILVVFAINLAGVSAWAQSAPEELAPALQPGASACRPFDAPPLVNVRLRDGSTLRGTLTCLGAYAELLSEGTLSRTALSGVTRITEPKDPLWNGAAIGATLGALIWLSCGGDCDGAVMTRLTAEYALVGLVLDSAITNNKTIYKAARRPTVSFRLRF